MLHSPFEGLNVHVPRNSNVEALIFSMMILEVICGTSGGDLGLDKVNEGGALMIGQVPL